MSRATVVLDASAILAFLFEEPGAETVQRSVSRGLVSAVNWAEVAQACLARGADPVAARSALSNVGLEIVPLHVAVAEAAAAMREATRPFGLSLADRCCLALAASYDLPALTTDGAWADASTPAIVVLIR